MIETEHTVDEFTVVVTDANLHRALDLPNAEERHTKMQLALRFSEVIAESGLTSPDVTKRTNLSRSEISDIERGKTGGFTIDRLLKALTALNQNVEIRVMPSREVAYLTAHVYAGV